ncbi:5-formyltetrahydrofolate cyclo-ligase [Neosynechococcus sphagnicola]|uniref:5-formyltetrahydrofolate cyclo-ligase n=1 Tax=Neosynechococcus sphagnicola TaxID=1501145 RepID=UPI001EFA066E|nr:5-formyltetrahydrofolate cyclo-ligase [Neosynechococcus sphagnicola]
MAADPSPSPKQVLRQALLQQRQSLTVEDWQHRSQQLCHQLQTTPQWQQAQTILAYQSFRQEPDLQALYLLDKQWGFPRCVGDRLCWHRWSPEGEWLLQIGAYGILEPEPDSPMLEPQAVDLILVPALACDRHGYRLGYGGGFL